MKTHAIAKLASDFEVIANDSAKAKYMQYEDAAMRFYKKDPAIIRDMRVAVAKVIDELHPYVMLSTLPPRLRTPLLEANGALLTLTGRLRRLGELKLASELTPLQKEVLDRLRKLDFKPREHLVRTYADIIHSRKPGESIADLTQRVTRADMEAEFPGFYTKQ